MSKKEGTDMKGPIPDIVPNTDSIERYPRIGWDRPKASDHCPLTIEVNITGTDTITSV